MSYADSCTADHPRSRGVYLDMGSDYVTRDGSSPLARGLLTRCRTLPYPTMDHPRSRGVYVISSAVLLRGQGSSPLARGLPLARPGYWTGPGIIPARAGFTDDDDDDNDDRWDHPRSRGVYLVLGDGGLKDGGSSPLARGLLRQLIPTGHLARIIPARAGFTRA